MSNTYRKPAAKLEGVIPYDPKYLPAETYLSANESPYGLSQELQEIVEQRLRSTNFNRYPDPLANELRDKIATREGLQREQVLIGNGGDELLFNLTLAWGGVGRTFLTMPPTFSAYADYAHLTDTAMETISLTSDFNIDEDAVLQRVAKKDIDLVVVTTPNNPTGKAVQVDFILSLLESSDALVLVDEAYVEFSGSTCISYLEKHKNLVILRTLSKAFGLAGVRLGYVLADAGIINELIKVRQPYSVDTVSQAIACCFLDNAQIFQKQVMETIQQREIMLKELSAIPSLKVYPTDANFILFKVADAACVWEFLYAKGLLIRDFSKSKEMPDCLRVSVGTPQENKAFINALKEALDERGLL